MKKYLLAILGLVVLFFAGCYHEKNHMVLRLGIDPSFIPLNTMGQEMHLSGYCSDLFQEVGKNQDEAIEMIKLSWDDLLPQLKSDKFDGIITTMIPYAFYKKDFLFSEPLITTGPVLISKKTSPYMSTKDLNEKIVGVISASGTETVANISGSTLIQSFENPSSLLDALVRGQIDAALLDYLIAYAYCKDLYFEQLVITSDPFGESGLRLMVKKTNLNGEKLLEGVNTQLLESGQKELLSKWNLPEDL